MIRFLLIVAVAVAALLANPGPVRAEEDACDSWILPCLGSILGIDKYNEEETKQTQIDADARVQTAGIEALADTNVAVQQTQQTLIIENGLIVRRAMELPFELQQTQIENQANVAITGITELGASKRQEIIQETRLAITRTLVWGGMGIFLIMLVALWLFRRQAANKDSVSFL